MTHPAALPVEELLKQCEIERKRRSGPGGQHRNKVETAVVITHRPSGIQGQASERRSQDLNRQMALQRLRVQLAIHLRTPVPPDKPSELWISRVHGRQLAVSSDHEDFPAILAEAIDALAAVDYDVGRAADHWGVSATQLVKLLKLAPEAFLQLNGQRATAGLKPLH